MRAVTPPAIASIREQTSPGRDYHKHVLHPSLSLHTSFNPNLGKRTKKGLYEVDLNPTACPTYPPAWPVPASFRTGPHPAVDPSTVFHFHRPSSRRYRLHGPGATHSSSAARPFASNLRPLIFQGTSHPRSIRCLTFRVKPSTASLLGRQPPQLRAQRVRPYGRATSGPDNPSVTNPSR